MNNLQRMLGGLFVSLAAATAILAPASVPAAPEAGLIIRRASHGEAQESACE
jgi:hypothetical protein